MADHAPVVTAAAEDLLTGLAVCGRFVLGLVALLVSFVPNTIGSADDNALRIWLRFHGIISTGSVLWIYAVFWFQEYCEKKLRNNATSSGVVDESQVEVAVVDRLRPSTWCVTCVICASRAFFVLPEFILTWFDFLSWVVGGLLVVQSRHSLDSVIGAFVVVAFLLTALNVLCGMIYVRCPAKYFGGAAAITSALIRDDWA